MKLLPGHNTLEMCEASLMAAVQFYLDRKLFQGSANIDKPVVQSIGIQRGDQTTFLVNLGEQKK